MSDTELYAQTDTKINKKTYETAWRLMSTAKAMTDIYEVNSKITSKYVHATSRGHEAIQLAAAMQLQPQDFVAPYYRDDSILLGIGLSPEECMLQLMAKRNDPFSGGRSYYCHPSLKRENMPKIPHQSSATGMQAIPTTGVAMGIQYLENRGLNNIKEKKPVVVCSLGDASITEGEVSEAFQMAVLKKLPIIYLIQDNEWDISANAKETRAMDAAHYAKGFAGLTVVPVDGSDFVKSYITMQNVITEVREKRQPFLVHAKVPLLNHHTSGVRMEWYRDDLKVHQKRDPLPKLEAQMLDFGFTKQELQAIAAEAEVYVKECYNKAFAAEDPIPSDLKDHIFAPSPIIKEQGEREPKGKEPTVMVDCALFAVQELLETHPEALLYGQDVGRRLGGVFREAATLAKKFGDDRVFNTPIQEAFIIGSTVGMSAVGCKPIVEVQFADYIWPGLNQLFTEVSRSNYLSNGKWPVGCVIRVPIGAYGSGGPYHSSSVEMVTLNIHGIKVAYPSNGADLKGLLKAAFYDPNPVVIFEHKGLYWSKIKGTESAKTIEPDKDYVVPFGQARMALKADTKKTETGEAAVVVTYGMGVHWAINAAKDFPGQISVLDLRTLNPWDKQAVFEAVQQHNRCMVLTEEVVSNSFAQALAGTIQQHCFQHLDAPISILGSITTPAIPLNSTLEQTAIPNAKKVSAQIGELLGY